MVYNNAPHNQKNPHHQSVLIILHVSSCCSSECVNVAASRHNNQLGRKSQALGTRIRAKHNILSCDYYAQSISYVSAKINPCPILNLMEMCYQFCQDVCHFNSCHQHRVCGGDGPFCLKLYLGYVKVCFVELGFWQRNTEMWSRQNTHTK